MKAVRIIATMLALLFVFSSAIPLCVSAEDTMPFDVDAKSAILVEASTGRVLYEKNADEALPPASVTKIMTLLLVMEAIDSGTLSLTDMVQTSENAAKMGGSQVYLEPGESMTVEDMLKSVIIASANDAATALAEHVAGSVETFVERMNTRASELGMANTHFENPTGLDDSVTNHLTSARDIALMSKELIKHETVLKYTTIWMDSIRNGEFGLTNTNRLIRFYNGANGLKTGSTSKALFCISATAKRDGMQLISVIMASPTRDTRNEAAKKLLDYGFANYRIVVWPSGEPEPIAVKGGIQDVCRVKYDGTQAVLEKSGGMKIETSVSIPESLDAPIKKGDVVGHVEYLLDGELMGTGDVVADEDVDRISFLGIFGRLLLKFFLS